MKTAVATLAAIVLLAGSAYAADSTNANGSKENPKSSAAATPDSAKHSAGTVGAMKNAEGGSFTADKADQKKDLLKKSN